MKRSRACALVLFSLLSVTVATTLSPGVQASPRGATAFVPARPRCFGAHGPHTAESFTPATVFRVARVRNGQIAGFALYRSWARPHWLQVESASDATLCDGPWSMGGDGQNASYTYADHNGRPPPPGRYSMAILRVRSVPALDGRPYHLVFVQLATRQVRLPAPDFLTVWSCDHSGPDATACISPYFTFP